MTALVVNGCQFPQRNADIKRSRDLTECTPYPESAQCKCQRETRVAASPHALQQGCIERKGKRNRVAQPFPCDTTALCPSHICDMNATRHIAARNTCAGSRQDAAKMRKHCTPENVSHVLVQAQVECGEKEK